MPPDAEPSLLTVFRRLFLRTIVPLVALAVAVSLLLPPEWVPHALFAVSTAMSVASAAAIPLVSRVPVLPVAMPPEQARAEGVKAFRSSIFRRFAVVQGAGLFGAIASFALDTSLPCLINTAVAIALMVLFVMPNARQVRSAEKQLDSGGARSGLSAEFGI